MPSPEEEALGRHSGGGGPVGTFAKRLCKVLLSRASGSKLHRPNRAVPGFRRDLPRRSYRLFFFFFGGGGGGFAAAIASGVAATGAGMTR